MTNEQIKEFMRLGIENGIPKEALFARIRQDMEMDPIQRLTSQFEGTPAIPTSAIAPIPDVGFNQLVPARIKRAAGVPLTGLGETLGVVGEGETELMRKQTDETLVDYLAQDPTSLRRLATAGLVDLGSELIPIAPGGTLGKQVAKRVPGIAGKFLSAAVAGAAEGAVAGVGETVGMDLEDRLKRGALMTAAGGAMGTLGASRSLVKDPGIADTRVGKFLQKYGPGEIVPEKVSRYEKFKQQWSDNLRPVERLVEGLDRTDISEDTAILAQAARTAGQTANNPIQSGTFDLAGKRTGESMDDILVDLDVDTYRDLEAYSMARRNLELWDQKQAAIDALPELKEMLKEARRLNDADAESFLEIEIKNAQRKARTKMDKIGVKDSREILAHLGDANKYGIDPKTGDIPILAERAKRLTEFSNRAVIDPLTEVGVFSRAEADTLKREGRWYVPFQRAVEELDRLERAGFIEPGLGTAPVKGRMIKHGLDPRPGMGVKDIFQQIGERAIQVHNFTQKQALRNHIADLADEFPDQIGREVAEVPSGAPGSTFRVFRDGQLKHYAADKDLLQAVETLNFKEANWVLKAARKMTNILRAGATLSLDFAFGNVARDMFPAAIYSDSWKAMPLVSPARAAAEELFHIFRGRGVTSEEWQAFMRSSGAHSTLVEGDRFDVNRHLEILRSRKPGKSETYAGSVARKVANEFKVNRLAPLQMISSGLERVNRYPEFKRAYRKALAEGKPPERAEKLAGLAAADITLNFSRAGEIGRRMNLAYAFSNAMFQDASKFGRAMKKSPFKTTVKGMAYLTAPTLYYHAKFANDEDYQSLPEWEKAVFVHVGKTESGKFIRIPIPPGILGMTFSYLPKKMADHFFRDDPNAIRELAEEMVDQSPLRYVPMPAGINSLQDATLNASPDILRPLLELGMNRSAFFDRPIMSERYKRLPPAERKSDRTTNIAKAIAGIGNAAGMGIAPIAVDHLIAGYGSSLGRGAAELTGYERLNKMPKTMEEDGIFKFWGPRRFLSGLPVGFSSQPVQDFYNFADMVDESAAGLKIQSTRRRRDNYLAAHPEALYGDVTNKVRQKLRDLSNARRTVFDAEDMDSEEREEMLLNIDQEVTRYTGLVMEQLYEAIQIDKAIAQGETE